MDWSDEVMEWLLEKDNPSVRFLTLTELLGKSVQSKEVKQTRKAIMDFGPTAEIIGAQNDYGSWGTPERFYNDKYTGSVWNLLLLAELRADPGEKRVQKAHGFHTNQPGSVLPLFGRS